MGCVQSKPNKRLGLVAQQEDFIQQANNNKTDTVKVRFAVGNCDP